MLRQILFVPLHTASMLEMIPIARKISDDGKYRPIFFIYRDIPAEKIKLLYEQSFLVIGPKAGTQSTNGKNSGSFSPQENSLRSGLRRWLKKMSIWLQSMTISSFFFYMAEFFVILMKASRLLDKYSVAAIITIGDRHVGWETALIKAGNRKAIPSLIVPYALSSPIGAATLRLRDQNRDSIWFAESWSGRLIGKIFPKWVFDFRGQRLLYLPAGMSLAAKLLGIMPETPWTIGGGSATRMAVESQKFKDLFIEQGVPSEKMVVTGKSSVDRLYEQMQEPDPLALKRGMGISDEQFVILCAVPQMAEHGFISWDQHWQEIEFLFATLAKQPAAVILSLHPKVDPATYRDIAHKYGVILASQRIYHLLPLCDIFIATYSSVVIQSIGIGKPTIVIDFLGLEYPYFDDEPGVMIARDRGYFKAALDSLVHDRQKYEKFAAVQVQRGPHWILLDGQCTLRLTDLMYQLIEEQPPKLE